MTAACDLYQKLYLKIVLLYFCLIQFLFRSFFFLCLLVFLFSLSAGFPKTAQQISTKVDWRMRISILALFLTFFDIVTVTCYTLVQHFVCTKTSVKMTACGLTAGRVSCNFFARSSESLPPFLQSSSKKLCHSC